MLIIIVVLTIMLIWLWLKYFEDHRRYKQLSAEHDQAQTTRQQLQSS